MKCFREGSDFVVSMTGVYRSLGKVVGYLSERLLVHRGYKHYCALLKRNNIPLRRLTATQKKQVNEVWNGHVKEFGTHELVLSATGVFDPYICSEFLIRSEIDPCLKNFELNMGMSEKNYFDRLFPEVPLPKTVARNINSSWLDKDYRPITADEALALMCEHERVFVKPSVEGGFGRGAGLFERDRMADVLRLYPKNCIVQEVFRQHAVLSALNPTSVNVMRVVSLHLNGKVTPVNCALRCGAAGSVTDVCITADGHGTVIIGVNPDGTIKDKGYYSCGATTEVAPSGQRFAGWQLPNFEQAMKLTTYIHERLPHFRHISFDICFAEDGTPTLMEYNIRRPGVLYYQYANGPLFGDRTKEIIDTLCK